VFEIVVLLVLIIANGVFAMSEIAVVSSRASRLTQLADAGDGRARAALTLIRNPNRFLATVQIGITLVGIFAGAYGGATLSQPLADALVGVPVIGAWSGSIAIAIVVIAITYLSLVVGELVPKRIALDAPERIAMVVAAPMTALAVLASPFVRLLGASTDALLRLLQVRKSPEAPVSDEEINALLRQGTEAGVFEPGEGAIVENTFWLGDSQVADLMTPRHEIVWVDVDVDADTLREIVAREQLSRYVVARGGLDDVVGTVHASDLLVACMTGSAGLAPEAVRPVLYVPETIPSLTLLDRFRTTGQHAALVVDEFGGVEGIVTVTDVLEALVGELPSASRPEDPTVVRRDDGSLLVDGALALEEVEVAVADARAAMADPSAERQPLKLRHDPRYRTLGGFLGSRLRRLPRTGDVVVYGGWRFEVVDMDGHRVDKVLIGKGRVERTPFGPTGGGREP
jgi:putative hemolysin